MRMCQWRDPTGLYIGDMMSNHRIQGKLFSDKAILHCPGLGKGPNALGVVEGTAGYGQPTRHGRMASWYILLYPSLFGIRSAKPVDNIDSQ